MLMRSMYSYSCVLRSRRVRHRTVKRLCEAMLERENDTVRQSLVIEKCLELVSDYLIGKVARNLMESASRYSTFTKMRVFFTIFIKFFIHRPT